MAKTISLADLGLLKKMLGLTASANDHEALTAIRKANSVLSKNKLTWDEVLSKTVVASYVADTVRQPTSHRVHDVEEDDEVDLSTEIKSAFATLRGKVKGDFANFITSLEEQFEEKGYLSPKQRRPLFEAANKVLGR